MSPHRADTKRLDRQPSHLRATCDIPVAEPTTAHLFTGRVSATPIASTYCLACMHVLDKAAREQSLHSVLGRREVFNTWNKLISLKCSRLPCNKFGQAATSLIWQAMFCDVLWVPVRYLSSQPPTSVPWYVCMSSSAAPWASGRNPELVTSAM